MRRKKQRNPVISIIILVIVAITAVIIIDELQKGFIIDGYRTKAFAIPAEGAFCSLNEKGINTIKIIVLNTGYQAELILDSAPPGSFIFGNIDEGPIPSFSKSLNNGFQGGMLKPGESGLLINYDCGIGGCSPGKHKIDLGTVSSVQHFIVEC